MQVVDKIKTLISNPQSVSIVNIMSTVLIYCLDNHVQIVAAFTFIATAVISIMTKWSAYKQDKLDRIHKRKMDILEFKSRTNQTKFIE